MKSIVPVKIDEVKTMEYQQRYDELFRAAQQAETSLEQALVLVREVAEKGMMAAMVAESVFQDSSKAHFEKGAPVVVLQTGFPYPGENVTRILDALLTTLSAHRHTLQTMRMQTLALHQGHEYKKNYLGVSNHVTS